MLSDFGQKILDSHFLAQLLQSSLSVQKSLDLVSDDHGQKVLTAASQLPDLKKNVYIKRRSAATQLQISTDFFTDVQKTYAQLKAIDAVIAQNIAENTVIWPTSYLPAEIQQPQNYNTPRSAAQINVRFVLPENLLQYLFEGDYQGQYATYTDFKNNVYIHLAQNIYRNLYILAYFFGATPSTLPANQGLKRSALQDQRFLNLDTIQSFEAYLTSLKKAARQMVTSALDAPLFLRPQAGDPEFHKGVQYLQLSVFDLQPNQADGLFEYQLQFIQLFLISALLENTPTHEELKTNRKLFFAVTGEDPTMPSAHVEPIKNYLTRLKNLNDQYLKNTDYEQSLQKMAAILQTPEALPATQLAQAYQDTGDYKYGQQLAQKNKRIAQGTNYQLRGYTAKNLETQQILSGSIKQGIHYRFLNETSEILQLKLGKHQEIISQGQCTSKNPLVLQSLLMDPTALSQLLATKQITTIKSFVSSDLSAAKAIFEQHFAHQALVIKPQQTLEPSATQIFKQPIDLTQFTAAFLAATDYDENVLIQAYLPESVYEFYVLDQQVLSIIEKVPSNVVGDGHSDIAALIDQKNDDQRRGHLGQKPLLTLELSAAVQAYLATQQLTETSVPGRGIQVFLDQRTAVAAGADTYNVLDEVDYTYQTLALEIAKILGLNQGTIEMVIPNIYQAYQPLQQQAIVTEVCATPSLLPHLFPYMGATADLTNAVLKSLFPELEQDSQ
ncbi:hypothetical protein ACFQ5M_03220 [Agrilactobacillus yilanensis]|uniref:ATP-grasp domain-containing protein n=1 Tax=Agrilactobacillus yilanensis TaxID=2485997 RepID=A0ABW4J6N6_9LACO|nr:hypothetical protein [Agrilactobacillus yilanensis]